MKSSWHPKMRFLWTILGLWLTLSLVLPVAWGQQPGIAPVVAVDVVGMTVADMDRSVEFYSKVLSFEKVSDVEV